MKIKSPLVNKGEAQTLCEAGAGELFCGIEPYNWRNKFKDFSINQRSTGANFTKLSELEKAISIAHRYKVKVHVAINAFFYLEEQYGLAGKIIKDLFDIGADGIILADAVLLLKLNRNLLRDKDIVIGCDATIFNSAGVKFYKNLGATRIVFDRAMALNEMRELVAFDKSLEYEVFIIHDLCFFVDGFCTYCKEATGGVKKEGRGRNKVYLFSASRIPRRGFGGGCRSRFSRQRVLIRNNRQIGKIRPFTFWMKKHIEGCGACAIYNFKEIGINSLKVLDRNMPTEGKIKATSFIRKCSDLLNRNSVSKVEYIEKCRSLFKETFKVKCNHYDCYYPSVFR